MITRMYLDRHSQAEAVAEIVAGQLERYLRERGSATLVCAGGDTPRATYGALGEFQLDWARVTVIPSDDRWFEAESPRSNVGMLHECLSSAVEKGARIVPLFDSGATPEQRAAELGGVLRPHLPASVSILGMGADMHTASLFPSSEGLEAAMADDAPTAIAMREPYGNEQRISLSARALLASGHIHILICGAGKRAALEAASRLAEPLQAPVSVFLEAGMVHYAD